MGGNIGGFIRQASHGPWPEASSNNTKINANIEEEKTTIQEACLRYYLIRAISALSHKGSFVV